MMMMMMMMMMMCLKVWLHVGNFFLFSQCLPCVEFEFQVGQSFRYLFLFCLVVFSCIFTSYIFKLYI